MQGRSPCCSGRCDPLKPKSLSVRPLFCFRIHLHLNQVSFFVFQQHFADEVRHVLVLLLQVGGVDGHGVDGGSQEEQSDHLPTRLPSRVHAQHLVVGHDVHSRWIK